MQVDWQTLQDLGILSSEGTQLSLFDWANSTRTAGGAQRLKERFRRPLDDIQGIRDTQAIVEWLMREQKLFDPLLGSSAWQSLERYIGSRVVALNYPNRLFLWLDSWWMRYLNGDLYREVLAALSLTQTLVHSAIRIEAQLSETELPPSLEHWRQRLKECIGSGPLQRISNAKAIHRLQPPAVLSLDNELRRQDFTSLRLFADLVYEIDLHCSLAIATRKHGLILPTLLENGPPRIEAEQLIHPLLEQAVGNPLRITSAQRVIFLTGPNMAGKSTYLKAAGIAVHLGQIGMGVPARVLRFTPFGCLFSGINTTDNLRLGESYFYREVRRVRAVTEILNQGIPTFALFDEMFKGTNLKDASDACLAVLTGFSECENSAFIIASHIAELAIAIEKLPGAAFSQFGATVQRGQATFNYRLADGVSEQRLGMLILEQEGVLARLQALRAAHAGPNSAVKGTWSFS